MWTVPSPRRAAQGQNGQPQAPWLKTTQICSPTVLQFKSLTWVLPDKKIKVSTGRFLLEAPREKCIPSLLQLLGALHHLARGPSLRLHSQQRLRALNHAASRDCLPCPPCTLKEPRHYIGPHLDNLGSPPYLKVSWPVALISPLPCNIPYSQVPPNGYCSAPWRAWPRAPHAHRVWLRPQVLWRFARVQLRVRLARNEVGEERRVWGPPLGPA